VRDEDGKDETVIEIVVQRQEEVTRAPSANIADRKGTSYLQRLMDVQRDLHTARRSIVCLRDYACRSSVHLQGCNSSCRPEGLPKPCDRPLIFRRVLLRVF